MIYFAVVLFGVSLISGISCFPNGMSLDDSELGKLLQNFKDAREVNSRRTELNKLRDLDIDLLTERVLDKLASGNEIQITNSESDEVPEINTILRALRNILGKNAEADLTDRSYPSEDEDQDEDETNNRRPQKRGWCWWCTGTRFAPFYAMKTYKTRVTTQIPPDQVIRDIYKKLYKQ